MPSPFLLEAPDLPTAWKTMVPAYESAQYRPLILQIESWDDKYAQAIENISEVRSENRWKNYIRPGELSRVAKKLESKDGAAIRFGAKKEGHGYHGERGDFCLVGGAIEGGSSRGSKTNWGTRHGTRPKRRLTLFYRSIELIGGFAYDLTLVRRLGMELGCDWKHLTIMAARANIFAVKKNSNEKLYPKLWEIFSE